MGCGSSTACADAPTMAATSRVRPLVAPTSAKRTTTVPPVITPSRFAAQPPSSAEVLVADLFLTGSPNPFPVVPRGHAILGHRRRSDNSSNSTCLSHSGRSGADSTVAGPLSWRGADDSPHMDRLYSPMVPHTAGPFCGDDHGSSGTSSPPLRGF